MSIFQTNFQPPSNIAKRDHTRKSVFLAGSIDQGEAEDWQKVLSDYFIKRGWNVFNPRRDNWDKDLKQEYENPVFFQQVNWELDALEISDLIVLYLQSGSKSPISLYELGKYTRSGKIVVICNDGFYRNGNVEVICSRDNIPLYSSIDDFLSNYKVDFYGAYDYSPSD